MTHPRVLLTAGYDRALHVYALAERLRRDGVEVAGVLVVSPFRPGRALRFVRQRGWRGFWAAARRLAGRATPSDPAADPLQALLDRHDIAPGSLQAWARTHGVAYRCVGDVNHDAAVRFVRERRPGWVVYGGGGILRGAFLEAARGRVLNAHQGPLPDVRGMNACEWSLLLGLQPTVTVHLIDRGVDTGGVLRVVPVPVRTGDTIQRLRRRGLARAIEALRTVILDPPASLPSPAPDSARTRQCFVLAPALRQVVEARLAAATAGSPATRSSSIAPPSPVGDAASGAASVRDVS